MAEARETAILPTAAVGAGGRIIASPFQYVTSGEDNLRVVSVNSLAGVRIKVQARRYGSNGIINAAAWDHTPNSDRTVTTDDYPLGVGALINLTVYASSGAPLVGQTFVIVQLIRGMGPAAIVLGTILQGYVTSAQHLGWPGSPIQSSLEGSGYTRFITGTDPAAGAGIAETVPTGARWQLIGLQVEFDTDATVANRTVFLDFRVGANSYFRSVPPIVVPASSGAFLSWGAGVTAIGNATYVSFQGSVPSPLIMPSGAILSTGVGAGQPGDDFRTPYYVVQEWLEVN